MCLFMSLICFNGANMQIESAVGEGAAAALSIREYLDNFDR